jgi:hypothetical protein
MDGTENDQRTRVDPGTPAGETLRRYRLPGRNSSCANQVSHSFSPPADDWDISVATEARCAKINPTPVPSSIAIAVQEPFPGGGAEDSNLACAASVPVSNDGEIFRGAERSHASVRETSVPSIIFVLIQEPLARAWSK